MLTQKHFGCSCGVITPTEVQEASDGNPPCANMLEAILMLGRGVRDAEGRHLPFDVPPAFALAVIRLLTACGHKSAPLPQVVAKSILENGW